MTESEAKRQTARKGLGNAIKIDPSTGAIRAARANVDGASLMDVLNTAPPDDDRPGYRRVSLLDLNGASVHGKFSLPPTIVIERVNFEGATFHDCADFTKAVFSGKATFSEAVFEWDALFSGAHFHQAADFSDAVFTGDARFASVRFGGEVVFHHRTCFRQTCSMMHTRFSADASFHYARFSGEWITAGAWGRANFNCHGITLARSRRALLANG